MTVFRIDTTLPTCPECLLPHSGNCLQILKGDAMNDGGPAFPYSALQPDEKTRQLVGTIYADNVGMSLLDWFAGQALVNIGAMNSDQRVDSIASSAIARQAYNVALHMLAERERIMKDSA